MYCNLETFISLTKSCILDNTILSLSLVKGDNKNISCKRVIILIKLQDYICYDMHLRPHTLMSILSDQSINFHLINR